ncbi:MAG: CRISPR-associated helicase Cas3' [Ignavibacteriaceae bacterium]|nr:CRISPR-associated helicase Cas3' [Ignavibacteriaceae bacterium]
MRELLLWAKTASDGTSYHPLIYHSFDIAAVSEEILTNRISRGKKRFINDFFPSFSYAELIKLLTFLTSLHDIGKATPFFQNKNSIRRNTLLKTGFYFPSEDIFPGKARHNFFSEMIIRKNLNGIVGDLFEQNTLNEISLAAGGHHGEFSSALIRKQITPKVLGNSEAWESSRDKIIKKLFEVIMGGKIETKISLGAKIRPIVFRYWFAGFITLSDWIASIEKYFPYSLTKSPENYFSDSREKAKLALNECGFPVNTEPPGLPDFSELFSGYQPRLQQSEVINIVRANHTPEESSLIIVEAPMGIGKTEISFYSTEIINSISSQTGSYIGMPTQATSNQMYLRFSNFIAGRMSDPARSNVGLLHSASDLFLSENENKPEGIADDDVESGETLNSQDWFRNKKRGLLAPHAVGTIDQVLLSVIRTKHNYLRLYGLHSKTVILDEVHSYDIYMSSLLHRFLSWAGELDISVIILSATLPRIKREELLSAFGSAKSSESASYPRISFASRTRSFSKALTPPAEKKMAISRLEATDDTETTKFIISAADKGGCIAVICNTVNRAQKLFTLFGESNTEVPSVLLHSRFPAYRRQQIEAQVSGAFGKNGNRPERMVLFSTQIIEQSLDIDFDLIITELCPADLLLQRAGRLHRFEGLSRPPEYTKPSLKWFITDEKIFEGEGKAVVYSPYVLYKTLAAISGKTEISIPRDIEPLIESVYDEEVSPEGMDSSTAERLRSSFIIEQEKMKMKAAQVLVPFPHCDDAEFQADYNLLDDEDPETNRSVAAATRLGDPALRVVCLLDEGKGPRYASIKKSLFDPEETVTHELIREILEAVVPVSNMFVFNCLIRNPESSPPDKWKKNSALRYLRIAVFSNGIFTHDSLTLRYDHCKGLIISNK